MNLKRVRSLMVGILPLYLPLFAACSAAGDRGADDGEAKVGVSAQAAIDADANGIAISGGDKGSLALMSDGSVWGSGDNTHGELGDGSTTSETTLTHPVSGLSGVTAVASAWTDYSLALKSDKTLWAWGADTWGQLGVGGNSADRLTPQQVSGLSGVTTMATAGSHALAVTSDGVKPAGTVWAWGINASGQLGDGNGGTTEYSRKTPLPVQVRQDGGLSPLSGATAVTGGSAYSLALVGGTVYAWGGNSSGQLGNGDTSGAEQDTAVPISMAPGVTITAIAAGDASSLALDSNHNVWAWGSNPDGQLGGNAANPQLTPVQVDMPSGVVVTAVAEGYGSSYALTNDGTIYAWGSNGSGQLGDGTTTSRSTPMPVHLPSGAVAKEVAAGTAHALARTSDGRVWGWGFDSYGQLGDSAGTPVAYQSTPVMMLLPCAGAPPAPDQCHTASVCDTSTGVWSTPNATDGTVCGPDQTCTSGVCGFSLSVSIRQNCNSTSPILETIAGAAGCVSFSSETISIGPSYATVDGAGSYTLYEGADCTGGKRQASVDTYFCVHTFDNGHPMNDNARSISFP